MNSVGIRTRDASQCGFGQCNSLDEFQFRHEFNYEEKMDNECLKANDAQKRLHRRFFRTKLEENQSRSRRRRGRRKKI